MVKANAAGIRQVFEVEGAELMAAAGPGPLHASPQAHVADIVPFGGAPNVLAPALEYDLGQLLRLTVALAAERDGGVGRHGHRHAVVANDVLITGAEIDGGAEEGAHAVGVADLAHPGGADRLRGRLQGRRQQGLQRLRLRLKHDGEGAGCHELGTGVDRLNLCHFVLCLNESHLCLLLPETVLMIARGDRELRQGFTFHQVWAFAIMRGPPPPESAEGVCPPTTQRRWPRRRPSSMRRTCSGPSCALPGRSSSSRSASRWCNWWK